MGHCGGCLRLPVPKQWGQGTGCVFHLRFLVIAEGYRAGLVTESAASQNPAWLNSYQW